MTVPTRDSDRTRSLILAAAQQAFSTRGYASTGVREITAAAGVNASLVSRYFGSKERLFEAALSAALDSSLITGLPKDGFGIRLVGAFVSTNTDRVNPLPMMLLATGDPGAREIADRLLRSLVIEPLSVWFGSADAEERASRLVVLASGFFLYRTHYPLWTWSGDIAPASRAWLERAFQSVVDDPA